MKRGKFIVLEGGDGSGKSACLEYLREKLVDYQVIFTQEPGGTEIGQEIRQTLLKHRGTNFNPLAELLLFVASRAQHVDELVRPKLYEGTHVICDRFAASSFAYQIRANERADLHHAFTVLHELALGETQPDLYLLLDVPSAVGRERVNGRGNANRLDVKERTYHERVRYGLIEYISTFHHRIIDASQPLAQVKAEVLAAVLAELTK